MYEVFVKCYKVRDESPIDCPSHPDIIMVRELNQNRIAKYLKVRIAKCIKVCTSQREHTCIAARPAQYVGPSAAITNRRRKQIVAT